MHAAKVINQIRSDHQRSARTNSMRCDSLVVATFPHRYRDNSEFGPLASTAIPFILAVLEWVRTQYLVFAVHKRDAPGLFLQFLERKAWSLLPITFSGVADCYQPVEHNGTLKFSKRKTTKGNHEPNPLGHSRLR
jgi:hypothetical protein